MVGNYSDKINLEITSVIRGWIKSCIIDEKWLEFYDLHLDDINTEFNKQETWLKASAQCLNIANKELSNHDFDIVLSIQLNSDNKLIGENFNNEQELERELSFTPPSLYLFNKKHENWLETLGESKKIHINNMFKDYNIYYREVLGDDGDYLRVLYVF